MKTSEDIQKEWEDLKKLLSPEELQVITNMRTMMGVYSEVDMRLQMGQGKDDVLFGGLLKKLKEIASKCPLCGHVGDEPLIETKETLVRRDNDLPEMR